MSAAGTTQVGPELKALRVTCRSTLARTLLDIVNPGAELIQGDVKPALLVVLKGRLGSGDEILPRFFPFHVFKDCLFHEVVRCTLLYRGQGRDAVPVGVVKFDGNGPGTRPFNCRGFHGATKDRKVTPSIAPAPLDHITPSQPDW